ncbi:MAG: aldehyde dehydrogenase family protein [Ardenticatenaceae bacterium]|nr:aldehyde dehydrogenase family protein [Ardenticatenaceae bacterium]
MSVLKLKHHIGGAWVDSLSGKTFPVYSPVNGSVIAEVTEGDREDARRAIAAARRAQDRIARRPPFEQAALCHRVADILESRKPELAHTLTLEQGKPYHTEALAEIDETIAQFRLSAEDIKRLETSVLPSADPNKRILSIRQPRGVYAVITPWNWPFTITAEYLAPGLAAGNAIVWVPAPTTSVCAVKLMECLLEAGVPEGVVNLVTGPGPVVGNEIVANPGTDAVGFTGSPATGIEVARAGAGKSLLLELGGNGPMIVREDANLEAAVEAAALGCFLCAGQSCSAAERLLVHERVYDDFVERMVAAARAVRLGDPFDPDTTMGPLNNEATAQKMDRHLQDAVGRGARVRWGGGRAEGFPTRLYYQPTVLDGVTHEMVVSQEESFGPIAPISRFASDDEAIEQANSTSYGLLAAVFTRDLSSAFHFAERLKAGIVNINESTNYWELHVPFGGSGKRSGIGRLGGKHTILEMTDLKTIVIDLAKSGSGGSRESNS